MPKLENFISFPNPCEFLPEVMVAMDQKKNSNSKLKIYKKPKSYDIIRIIRACADFIADFIRIVVTFLELSILFNANNYCLIIDER